MHGVSGKDEGPGRPHGLGEATLAVVWGVDPAGLAVLAGLGAVLHADRAHPVVSGGCHLVPAAAVQTLVQLDAGGV